MAVETGLCVVLAASTSMTEQAMVKRQTTVRRIYRRILFGSFGEATTHNSPSEGLGGRFSGVFQQAGAAGDAIRLVRPHGQGGTRPSAVPDDLSSNSGVLSFHDINVFVGGINS